LLRQALLACVLLACVLLPGGGFEARADTPPNHGAILIVGPDMQLAARSVAGDAMTQPDWSRAAEQNLANGLDARLRASNRSFQFVDPSLLMQGRYGQLLRLHAIVADAALEATRRRGANGPRWSIGAGAQDLADGYHADYALILGGAGVYGSPPREVLALASNLRTAASAATGNVGAAASLGLHALRLGGGGRRMAASLIDLRSGDIVWIRQVSGGDPRTPEGAARLLRDLFRNSPL